MNRIYGRLIRSNQLSVIPKTGIGVALLIVAAISVHASQTQNSVSDWPGLIVKLNEFQMGSGESLNNCVEVSDDGHFHLELRRQRQYSPSSEAQIYDSTLTDKQLLELRQILNSEPVWDLPPLVPLDRTVPKTWVGGFQAEVIRGDTLTTVGYFEFGHHEMESNKDLDEVSDPQQKIALKPLLEWFHKLSSTTSNMPTGQSTLCGDAPSN